MLLSIIVPIYNVEKYVEKCIRSCEAQDISKEDYEIVVINDGSPDNSLKIVERIADEFPNIKIISQPNKGLSAARNTGMRNASGDYYMFVDSDDWIAEKCLGKICSKLRTEQPDALAICAANVKGDGMIERRQTYADVTPVSGYELLKKGVSPCAPFAIWSVKFFKKYELSFFEGIFHEDSEFTPRAYYLAEKVSFVNDIIYYVFQNPNSITRTPNPKRAFDLVNVVCTHLSKFCKSIVRKEHRPVFYNLIALYLNNALAYICMADKRQQKMLDNAIFLSEHLILDMQNATSIKYRLEVFLFRVFPKHYVRIYKILKLRIK